MDRYNHDLGGEDTDDTDDTPVFGSFSSYTPQYRKQHYSWSREPSLTTASVSCCTNNTSTTSLNTTIPAVTTTAIVSSETKLQVTATVSTSSPTNTVDSVSKCRKIVAPLSSPSNAIAQQMVNKVLNTPQLRKIEVC